MPCFRIRYRATSPAITATAPTAEPIPMPALAPAERVDAAAVEVAEAEALVLLAVLVAFVVDDFKVVEEAEVVGRMPATPVYVPFDE